MSASYYSVTDAAAALGVSTQVVRKLANRGRLPCERTVSGWRIFRAEDVERLRQLSEARPSKWHRYPKEVAS